MQRNYLNALHAPNKSAVEYFVGYEIEKTCYHGLKTLFVVGCENMSQRRNNIQALAASNGCQHIFFGANHSFTITDELQLMQFEGCLTSLSHQFKISLDVGTDMLAKAKHANLHRVPNICLQIRLVVPGAQDFNQLTQVKVDDVTFNSTNPGVWTVPLTSIMVDTAFTGWSEYSNDEILP
jgi:hypothetical protein